MKNIFEDAAIVTVRNSSSRLPNKPIMKINGDIRSIDVVINRAKKTGFPVIIATSTSEDDNIFEDVAKQHDVKIFRGSLFNKIKRWYDCFNKFNIKNALLLDGDDLCHDFNLGKRALELLKEKNSHMVINPPDIVTGFFTYAINKDGIFQLYAVAKSNDLNTDVITKFIENAHLKLELVELESYQRKKKIRLTLDYSEDLEFFKNLYEHVDISEDPKKIIEFLTTHKEISEINYLKEKDYLENQSKFNNSVS